MRFLIFLLTVAALVPTAAAADKNDVYGQVAEDVAKNAPPGTYSSWVDKDSKTKKIGTQCIFLCTMLVESPKLSHEVMVESGQACFFTCLAKAMPMDWPSHAKMRDEALDHFDKAIAAGSPLTVRPNIDP